MTSILLTGLVVGLVLVTAAIVGAYLVWRAISRWMERRVELWTSANSMAVHKMWRAVQGAEKAVRRCGRAGATVGDLPSLARRLRPVAEDVERALRLGSEGARAQLLDVMHAATDLRGAAAAALAELSAPRARQLAADAERELRSVSAGLERSRQLVD